MIAGRIEPEESLFVYPPGRDYFVFQDETFFPLFASDIAWPDSATEQQAASLCGTQPQCLFDFFVTMDRDFAEGTRDIQRENEEVRDFLGKI